MTNDKCFKFTAKVKSKINYVTDVPPARGRACICLVLDGYLIYLARTHLLVLNMKICKCMHMRAYIDKNGESLNGSLDRLQFIRSPVLSG